MLEYLKEQHSGLYQEIFEVNGYCVNPEDVKDKTVLDIGANRGFFSLLCNEYGAKKIIAVEALTSICEILRKNVEGKDNITVRDYLITGFSPEDLKFHRAYMYDQDNNSSIYSKPETNSSPLLVCPFPFVNFLKEEQIEGDDLVLKMDVEGSEYDILLNTPPEILKRFKTIFIEIHENMHPKHKGYDLILNLFPEYARKECPQLMYYSNEHPQGVPAPVKTFKLTRRSKRCLGFMATRSRYDSTFALALWSMVCQTVLPDKIVIWDDNATQHTKDIRTIPLFERILRLMDSKGIQWEIKFGNGRGQHFGHQYANKAGYEYVWRVDDDEIAEPNVLEKLLSHMTPEVGAVGGTILDGNGYPGVDGKIAHTFGQYHIQLSKGEGIVEVEHIYSSFLYRAGISDYNLNLSPVAHREETLFTYPMVLKEYKLLIDRSVITHHFRAPKGGIRDNNIKWFFDHDEKIFAEQMEKWGYKIIMLNNGLGDHLAFKNILPDLRKKYKHIILGVCYPDVFKDEPDVTLTTLAALMGAHDEDNVYKWMAENNWKESIVEAYREMFL